MGNIALAMIVRDEPVDRLAMLIEYVKPVISQVVIADTGSQDYEIDHPLYNSWGVDTYQFDWIDDFAAARNSTLDHLHDDVDWVLHLDADELPSWEMIKHLAWIKDNAPTKVKGYKFFTTNFWGGERGIEVEAHWHVRLFRRASGRWYKKLHEQVMINKRNEEQAFSLGEIEKAAREAYLIHSKPREMLDKSALLYQRIEGP